MAAGIEEHHGKAAGRVTIVTTLLSVLPTFLVAAFIAIAFVIDLLSQEVAGPMFLTALGLGGAVTGTVFAAAKNTKTDQADVIWGSAPVSDVVTPVGEVVSGEVVAGPADPEEEEPVGTGAHRATLSDEVASIRQGV